MGAIKNRWTQMKHIFQAFTSPVPINEKYWQERMEICDTCEWNSKNKDPEELSLEHRTRINTIFKGEPLCTACGCCIPLKAGVRAEKCGLSAKGMEPKWNQALTDDSPVFSLKNKGVIAYNLSNDIGVLSPIDGGFRMRVTDPDPSLTYIPFKLKIYDSIGFKLIKQVHSCGCTASSHKTLDAHSAEFEYSVSMLNIADGGKLDVISHITYQRPGKNKEETLILNTIIEKSKAHE